MRKGIQARVLGIIPNKWRFVSQNAYLAANKKHTTAENPRKTCEQSAGLGKVYIYLRKTCGKSEVL